MIVRIEPGLLHGSVSIPASKSHVHRLLIAASLADKPTSLRFEGSNRDIEATSSCLRALGAGITVSEGGACVLPLQDAPNTSVDLDCGESGSTLRFLLPVAAALGAQAHFSGHGRLPQRPNSILTEALRKHGVQVDGDLLPINISGKLIGGDLAISGAVSSQYITGLLLALPLCAEDSTLRLTEPLQSASYVDLTLKTMHAFGLRVDCLPDGWAVPGRQLYTTPAAVAAEGDWSSACFWLAAEFLGGAVQCLGLDPDAAQGDRVFPDQLSRIGTTIDVSDTPDTVPALAICAASHPGVTRITGAGRLRYKESDRLEAVRDMLDALGAEVRIQEDDLVIAGVSHFRPALIDGKNDHRIVMAAAIAATRATGPVRITDAQAVDKSYPDFFKVFRTLGGHAYVE